MPVLISNVCLGRRSVRSFAILVGMLPGAEERMIPFPSLALLLLDIFTTGRLDSVTPGKARGRELAPGSERQERVT